MIPFLIKSQFFCLNMKHLPYLFRKSPLSPEPLAKFAFIQLSSLHIPDAIQYFFFSVGKMMLQPVPEQVLDTIRKPHDGIAGMGSPSLPCSFQNIGTFVVG